MFRAAVARSSSVKNTIRYVLPVLWMMSRFRVNWANGSESIRRRCLFAFARWRHQSAAALRVWGRRLLSLIALFHILLGTGAGEPV